MAAYSPIPQEDWLTMFQRNWCDSKHWVVDGDDIEEELWLMCDPDVDATCATSLEDLLLLFFHPRQKLPHEHFYATLKDGNLNIRGRLEGRKLSLTFRPSKKKLGFFYAYMDDSKIEFDSQNPRKDMFFYDLTYKDPLLKKGAKVVLYNGQLWRFVKWNGGSPGALRIERHDKTDDSIEIRNPSVRSCLRLQKNVQPRSPYKSSSSSRVLDGSDSSPYSASHRRSKNNREVENLVTAITRIDIQPQHQTAQHQTAQHQTAQHLKYD